MSGLYPAYCAGTLFVVIEACVVERFSQVMFQYYYKETNFEVIRFRVRYI